MTVKQLSDELALTVLAGEAGLENEIQGCYIGDLLSWVMARVSEGDVWITVMGNVNAVAVAKLSDVACMILCEGAHLDDESRKQAEDNQIPVLSCDLPAFALGMKVSAYLPKGAA